jgi:hypothetical protein
MQLELKQSWQEDSSSLIVPLIYLRLEVLRLESSTLKEVVICKSGPIFFGYPISLFVQSFLRLSIRQDQNPYTEVHAEMHLLFRPSVGH